MNKYPLGRMLIVRELLYGSRHFNDFRRALPPMSPGLISKRLQTLQQHGIVERHSGSDGHHASEYRLTPAGEGLRPIVAGIGEWGQRWVRSDLRAEELDPGALMWYVHRHFRRDAMPPGRIVLHIDLVDVKGLRHWWLVVNGGEVDLCAADPGFDVDIEMQVDLLSLTQIYIGDLDFAEARARGKLQVQGPKALTREMHRWFARSRFADINPRPAMEAT